MEFQCWNCKTIFRKVLEDKQPGYRHAGDCPVCKIGDGEIYTVVGTQWHNPIKAIQAIGE